MGLNEERKEIEGKVGKNTHKKREMERIHV